MNNKKVRFWIIVGGIILFLLLAASEIYFNSNYEGYAVSDQNYAEISTEQIEAGAVEESEGFEANEESEPEEADQEEGTPEAVIESDAPEPVEPVASAEPVAVEPVAVEPAPVVTPVYVFRNQRLLNEHYEKHGIEMGFTSAEAYQAAASAVITNPNSLFKIEAEDGDGVYYLEATNEFVVLSTDGYIRTYFLPSSGKAYFDRQ